MSTLGNELSAIAQTEIPALADDFPDTLSIVQDTSTPGPGGGQIKTGTSNYKTGVPCIYEPAKDGTVFINADKMGSLQPYKITLPIYWPANNRISVDPQTHTLVIDARGSEPQKVFRIDSVKDIVGVLFEVLAGKED